MRQYTYDAEGNITGIGGSTTATYAYNEGQRTGKTTSAGWTDYIYLNGQPVAEQYSDGTETDYIYANGQKIAKATNTAYFPASTDFYVADQVGSTQVELSGTGTILWQGAFTPFGQEILNGGTSNAFLPQNDGASTHYKFTGKERDTESGLDYFGARYMSSNMGRFMSPDPSGLFYANPANPQSLNLYSYVFNNPLKFIDPTGMECVWDDGSFDSNKDKSTGSAGDCSAQGGNWVDHNAFSTLNAGDWSSQANEQIANIADALNGSSTTLNVNGNGSGSVNQIGMNISGNVPYLVKSGYSWQLPLNEQYIRAIAAAAPTICGGGVFGYLTRESGVGPVDVSGGAYGEYDSRSGGSTGTIGEVGGQTGTMLGGVGTIASSQGITGLAYGGAGVHTPIVSASAGGVGFTNGVGVYAEVGIFRRVAGGGGYVNITTNAACLAKQ